VLRVRTFGGLLVHDGDRPVAGAAAQPRRLAILALLAVAGDRGVTRDRLLAYLWADADEERARRGLTQALYALRRDLGSEEAILGLKDLRLNPEIVSSDVQEFEQALRAGPLERAADLYVGPFLDGFQLSAAPEFMRWADGERSRLGHLYAEALERLARSATERGEHRAAAGWWRKLAAANPLDARVAIGVMQALVAAGDRAGALQHARLYEMLVEQEPDIPADPEVRALAERVRREPTPEAAVAPPPPAPSPEPAIAAASVPAAEPSPVEPPAAAAGLGSRAPPLDDRRRWKRLATAGLVGAIAAGLGAAWLATRGAETIALGQAERVTIDPGLELDPALSPDGTVIAYAADLRGPMQLYVSRVGGGHAVPITDELPGYHRWPQWSPDGTRIAFQAAGSIYVVPALGGVARLLIAPSPGTWVAYPAWSPSGREMAYVEDDVIYTRSLDGGAPRRIARAAAPHSLAWSPDGAWIAFVSGNRSFTFGSLPWGSPMHLGNVAPSSLWLAPARGGTPVRLTDERSLNVSPVWLPGGRRLLFVSNRDGSRDVYELTIDRAGAPTGRLARLSTGLNAQTISVARDGRRLAYAVFAYSANIWSIPIPERGSVSASVATPVTTGNQTIEAIGVSPDGRWLAYDSDRTGIQHIYLMPAAGGEAVQLSASSGDDFMSAWSPDGREIAFSSYRDGTRRVRVMSADGGESRVVADSPVGQGYPGWSPDGRSLVFHSSALGRFQLYVVSRNADSSWGTPRRLVQGDGRMGRWSPDGRQIAYVRADGLWLVSSQGGEPRPLVRVEPGASQPAPDVTQWSPDGRTLYYKAFDAEGRASLWSVPAAGGPPTLLVRFDDPARQSNRPEFATDGTHFFFTIGRRESDVWAMELAAP